MEYKPFIFPTSTIQPDINHSLKNQWSTILGYNELRNNKNKDFIYLFTFYYFYNMIYFLEKVLNLATEFCIFLSA